MKKSFLLSFVFLSLYGWSQSPNLQFHNLSTDEGLSNQLVTSFCQDKTGRMWIGTFEGLNMYDGKNITVYRHDKNNPHSLSSDNITDLALHPNGNLIIATQGGINIYDPVKDKFSLLKKRFKPTDFEIPTDCRGVYLENSDSLWIATGNGLLLHNFKDSSVIRFVPDLYDPETISSRKVNNIYKDSRGNIWFGTIVGLNLCNRKENKFKRYLSNTDNKISINGDRIIDIYEDSQNILWISTSKGLLQFNYENETFIRFNHNSDNQYSVPLGQSSVILEDSRNRLWIAFQSALTYYDRNTNWFYKILPEEGNPYSLAGKEIWSIYEDNKGSVWFGTNGNGVSIFDYDNKAFVSIQHQIGDSNSLSSNMVSQIDEDSKGNLWIALKGDGFNYYNRKDDQYIHFKHDPANPNSLSTDASLCLLVDHNDEVWVGTWGGGLNRYNPKTGKFKTYMPNGEKGCISGINVWYVFEDKQNNIWVGTHENGLNLFDRETETFTSYSFDYFDSTTISHNLVWYIFEDSKNNLWLSTPCGLNLFNREKGIFKRYFVDFTIEKGIKACKYIVFMLEDSKNRLWLGRNDGLVLFDSDSLKHKLYDESNGLINKSIKGILEDKSGMLWVTTSNGLSKFNPETEEFKNYTTGNGLISNQFETKSATLLSTGEFALGTQNGIQLFYPDSIMGNQYPPPIILTGFSLFNEPVHIGDKDSLLKQHINYTESITLKHDQSVFTIYYAGLNYVFPEQNQYKYKMEGFDKNWNDVKNKTEATYTNLDPGSYIFKVKASNNNGVWNNQPKELEIIILPPWWQTWWFRIAGVSFILALIIGIYYYRVNAIKQKNRELEKIVDDRTKELKSKNKTLREQTDTLNETNSLLEERQQQIEEQSEELLTQKEKLQTNNKQLEEQSAELRKQKEKLQNYNKQLEELNATKDKFFSIIAHDIKNPFNILLGFSELLKNKYNDWEDKKRLEFIDTINNTTKNTYELLENLLHWSRSQRGMMEFNPRKIEIEPLLKSVVVLLTQWAEQKGIHLKYSIDSSVSTILADEQMLQTIIRNLVNNALKFTNRDGTVELNVFNKDKYSIIEVKDDGVGMDQATQEKLFKIDKNVTKLGTNKEKGTGLGLILVNEFVNKHNGEIHVKSIPGEGSSFTILFPKIILT